MNRENSTPFVDYPLLSVILMLCGISLIVLYSAGGENLDQLTKHAIRAGFALCLMLVVSRIPPSILARYSLHIYLCGLGLLFVVLAAKIQLQHQIEPAAGGLAPGPVSTAPAAPGSQGQQEGLYRLWPPIV